MNCLQNWIGIGHSPEASTRVSGSHARLGISVRALRLPHRKRHLPACTALIYTCDEYLYPSITIRFAASTFRYLDLNSTMAASLPNGEPLQFDMATRATAGTDRSSGTRKRKRPKAKTGKKISCIAVFVSQISIQTRCLLLRTSLVWTFVGHGIPLCVKFLSLNLQFVQRNQRVLHFLVSLPAVLHCLSLITFLLAIGHCAVVFICFHHKLYSTGQVERLRHHPVHLGTAGLTCELCRNDRRILRRANCALQAGSRVIHVY